MHRWEENIKMGLKEIGINTRNWVDSPHDRDYSIETPASISHGVSKLVLFTIKKTDLMLEKNFKLQNQVVISCIKNFEQLTLRNTEIKITNEVVK